MWSSISIIEQLKIVDSLTNRTARCVSAMDAFHLVLPLLRYYGFSGKATTTGGEPGRVARAWVELMRGLARRRFVAKSDIFGEIAAA